VRVLPAALLLIAAFPAAASAAKRCGDIARVGEAGTEIVKVSAAHVGCATARRVLVRHTLGRSTSGWSCNSAGSEAVCTRGRAVARYRHARSRGCGSIGFEPQSDNVAGRIRARHVGCRAARAVARGSRPYGPSHASSYRARRFHCTARPGRTTGLETALYTCRRGHAIVAFERA
jgi:hypothetical protein